MSTLVIWIVVFISSIFTIFYAHSGRAFEKNQFLLGWIFVAAALVTLFGGTFLIVKNILELGL